jgi:hypothetical protein
MPGVPLDAGMAEECKEIIAEDVAITLLQSGTG